MFDFIGSIFTWIFIILLGMLALAFWQITLFIILGIPILVLVISVWGEILDRVGIL